MKIYDSNKKNNENAIFLLILSVGCVIASAYIWAIVFFVILLLFYISIKRQENSKCILNIKDKCIEFINVDKCIGKNDGYESHLICSEKVDFKNVKYIFLEPACGKFDDDNIKIFIKNSSSFYELPSITKKNYNILKKYFNIEFKNAKVQKLYESDLLGAFTPLKGGIFLLISMILIILVPFLIVLLFQLNILDNNTNITYYVVFAYVIVIMALIKISSVFK